MEIEQLIELTIDNLGSSGEGVGKLNGMTVFVEGALPGERVMATIEVLKSNYATARLTEIITPSPHRVKAPCPYYDRCGGCQLQHLSYPEQLVVKRQRVIDAFERIGKIRGVIIEKCVPSPQPFGYRNKIQLPIVQGTDGIKIGLYARGSHDVVPIDHCMIHCSQGEEVFKQVRSSLMKAKIDASELKNLLIRTTTTEESLVTFVTRAPASAALKSIAKELVEANSHTKGVLNNVNRRDDNVVLSSDFTLLAGQETVQEKILGLCFTVSAASFFQVNPLQAEQLYEAALEMAQLEEDQHVLDAYCGVGVLTLQIASYVKSVIGIEVVPQAVEDAKRNADDNHKKNVEFICNVVEKAIQGMGRKDVVFLNPPRKGCDPKVIQALGKIRPKKIIYISCDPATLARDVAQLITYGYEVNEVQPFDMFPQTAHVETIVCLTASV